MCRRMRLRLVWLTLAAQAAPAETLEAAALPSQPSGRLRPSGCVARTRLRRVEQTKSERRNKSNYNK